MVYDFECTTKLLILSSGPGKEELVTGEAKA